MGNKCCGGDDKEKTETAGAPMSLASQEAAKSGAETGTKASDDESGTENKTASVGAASASSATAEGSSLEESWKVPVKRHRLHKERMFKGMEMQPAEVQKPVFTHTRKLK